MQKPPNFAKPPSVSSPIFWHFVWRLLPWAAAIGGYVLVATAVVVWDMDRHGEKHHDFGAELYGVYMQLFFEPTEALPKSTLARIIFWITPLLGVGLLARGIVRVGASVFDVEERKKLWVKIMSDQMSEHIIVCGLGHVGIRVVESLRALDIAVLAIEESAAKSFAPQVEGMGIPVVYGDARRDDILVGAGIRRARAVVCATDDDLTNLEVAIDAKRENPSIRVIMRVFDQRVAGKIGTALDLDETFSPAALAGPLVALQAIGEGVLGAYRLGDGSLRVDMEVPAPKAWWGLTVEQCEDAVDGRVVRLERKNKELARPRHDTTIGEGDVVTLDLPAARVAQLNG